MELRENWDYHEFPEYTETPEGVSVLETDGSEIEVLYTPDVIYAVVDGIELHLQMLLPSTRSEKVSGHFINRPCILYVQGSAWMKQNIYQSVPAMSKLAELGYVVAIVEYRHSGIASFPAQIKDTRNAIRFIRLHAEEYHVDSEAVFVSGGSSGGHTAVFTGIIQDDDTADNLYPGISADVSGIIDFYGATSFMEPDSNPSTVNHGAPETPEGMVMGGVNLLEHPDLQAELSAETHLTPDLDLPPVLIFHGTKDRIVNTTCSVILYRKLKELQKDVAFYLIKGADHGGAEFSMPQVLSIIDEFVKANL